MNRPVMETILDKIKEYDRILLFRHIRMDGDCVGATKGFKEILKLTFPEKEILIADDQHSDYLSFLGPDDGLLDEEMYGDALAIVLDTGTADRVSNQKFKLCKEVVKIDHHIPVDDYGMYTWVEEEKSSCCEMIAEFYYTFRDELKINAQAATYLYTGMVTDSGRFRFRSVSGDTMRYAGLMLDQGIDTDRLYAHLYLQEFDYLKFESYVYEKMKMTENGVAYIVVDKEMQEKFHLTQEAASGAVSFLDSIKGSIVWMAFIENNDPEHTIRVRLRSRFVHVDKLANDYHGGGHACASGATVYSPEEMEALISDADALIKEYKETHEDWL